YAALARKEFGQKPDYEQLLRTLVVEGDVYAATRDEQRLASLLDEAAGLVDTVGNEGLEIDYQLLYATKLYFLEDYEGALAACETLYSSLDRADTLMERDRIR